MDHGSPSIHFQICWFCCWSIVFFTDLVARLWWTMAATGAAHQSKAVPSLTRCCHSVILRYIELIVVCWFPQTLNIRSIIFFFDKHSDAKIHPKSLKTWASWCLLIIIITIIMMIPRYTHHVIWRRVDPPNPCYSLCYRWNAMMAP